MGGPRACCSKEPERRSPGLTLVPRSTKGQLRSEAAQLSTVWRWLAGDMRWGTASCELCWGQERMLWVEDGTCCILPVPCCLYTVPDSLLPAWHPGLDVFPLTTAANRPESLRLRGLALELSRSSLQLKEQGHVLSLS